MAQRDGQSVNITNARAGHSADLHHRQVRYLLSMAIRTVCFVAAVAVDGPLRWILIAAAIFLPYVAVILANAGSRREPETAEQVTIEPVGEIAGYASRQPPGHDS